ncbi:alpha/beta fold hydrolase [Streptomyces azureus]|uniref:alpha/beta fold hydrolase n=1 Tax=Streptomyces azureus TaxID=146537 RepID=UPI0022A9F0D1|nr:alpha/beta hydrolase [Streptomyces azureus]
MRRRPGVRRGAAVPVPGGSTGFFTVLLPAKESCYHVRPVILVHGLMGTEDAHFGGCRRWWTHSVTEMRLPGHGIEGGVPSHPAAAAIDRLREAINEQPEPPVVVGLSYLGAAVAFRAAENAPTRVAGVVMSGYSFLVAPDVLNRWLTGFTRMAARQQRARDHFVQLHGKKWEKLLTATFDEIADGCLRLPGADELKRFEAPVQLVNGALLQNERNAIGPAAASGADVAVVAGAGHVVPVDAPRVFAATVEEFADRIDAGHTAFHERRRAADRAAQTEISAGEGEEAEETTHV